MKVLCVCVLLLVGTAAGKRFGGFGGGGRRGGSSSKHRVPSPAPPPSHSGSYGGGHSGTFLNAERAGSSSGGGTTHNRGNPFSNPQPQPPPHTNGPVGFERFGSTSNQGGHQIGFDKVNSPSYNKQNPYNPSAPPAPGPVGPPPAYPGSHSGGGHYGGNDHPPAYPGRPMNAPPVYTPNSPHYPHQNQYNPSYGSFPGYGNSPYPGTFGGGALGGYHGNTYQGNSYGGSPFGGGGYGGNPYYSPNNFGYSNNPGYFGGSQYDYQKKSRFGGLPIPIPIPIPIPFGGGFGGFGGGYGGLGSHYPSYNHRVLHTFIRSSNTSTSNNSSTAVFLLNNSTVAPCTTDHFVYDKVKVSTMACTAQSCTAVRVQTRTNVSAVETVHGGSVTLCLEGDNATVSSDGEIVVPTVSEVMKETLTVCRNVSSNVTSANGTEEATTTTAPETTTMESTTTTAATTTVAVVNTTVCEKVNCSSVEMCLPAVELLDPCTGDCPFRRTGYKPCVLVKMCRAPSAPVSTFATLNTTISKIDEFNKHQSVYDAANLTLISYHPPVIPVFNVTNATATTTTTTTTAAP